jgi:hypothetical protein
LYRGLQEPGEYAIIKSCNSETGMRNDYDANDVNMWRRSRHAQWSVFAAIVLLGSGKALACTCSDPAAEDQASVADHADIVFVGEVEQVSLVTHRGLEEVRATFKVLKLTKGPKTDSIQIVVHHGGTSCDLVRADFKVGDRYLLSGNKVIWSSEKTGKTPEFARHKRSISTITATCARS